MSEHKNQEIRALWKNLYQTAVDAEVPTQTAFGEECNQLLRTCYTPLFDALFAQESLSTNPLLDAIATSSTEACQSVAQLSGTTTADLCKRVESSSDFYQFLIDEGIVGVDDPSLDDDLTLDFAAYVKQRDALQAAYIEGCAEYGTPIPQAKKKLAEFDRYFKIQLINEHFHAAASDALHAWMEHLEQEQMELEPATFINTKGAQKQPGHITSHALKDLPGFSLN